MKAIIWKVKDNQFGPNAKNAYVGRVKVGSVIYNGITSDDKLKYIASIGLPSIKFDDNKRPTEKEAMNLVERVVSDWFKETE